MSLMHRETEPQAPAGCELQHLLGADQGFLRERGLTVSDGIRQNVSKINN
jgi:hypothetical protein